MANTPKSINAPIAITHRSEVNLSAQHITTSNFMSLDVAKTLELVPGQSVNIEHNVFTRLEPMPIPTFGNANINCRAFFVPFRTIFPAWNDFIDDVVHVNQSQDISHISTVHMISNYEIVKFLTANSCSELEDTTDDPGSADDYEDYDIVTLEDINGVRTYRGYNLKPYGRRCLKILLSLGYAINFDLTQPDIMHSALPLLAFGKVYFDWYYPQAYTQDSRALSLMRWFVYDSDDFVEVFGSQDLEDFFNIVSRVSYDSDFFTSSWDNPAGPTTGSFSNVTIPDPTLNALTESQRPVISNNLCASATDFENYTFWYIHRVDNTLINVHSLFFSSKNAKFYATSSCNFV